MVALRRLSHAPPQLREMRPDACSSGSLRKKHRTQASRRRNNARHCQTRPRARPLVRRAFRPGLYDADDRLRHLWRAGHSEPGHHRHGLSHSGRGHPAHRHQLRRHGARLSRRRLGLYLCPSLDQPQHRLPRGMGGAARLFLPADGHLADRRRLSHLGLPRGSDLGMDRRLHRRHNAGQCRRHRLCQPHQLHPDAGAARRARRLPAAGRPLCRRAEWPRRPGLGHALLHHRRALLGFGSGRGDCRLFLPRLRRGVGR